jgi:hypothetical protein
MARIHVMAWMVWLGLTALPTPSFGQDAAPDGTLIPDLPDGKRSYAQSAMTKIRPGSALQGPETVAPKQEMPGTLAQRRDALVRQHYSHMAELDVISDQAQRAHDVASAERAETLRRRDTQTFFLTMQTLRRLLLKQQAEAGP